MSKPRVGVRDHGNCFVGEIDFPLDCGGNVRVATVGLLPAASLRRAASFATRVITDPALAPFVPPQASLAIKTARAAARAVERASKPEMRRTASSSSAARKLTAGLARKERAAQAKGFRGVLTTPNIRPSTTAPTSPVSPTTPQQPLTSEPQPAYPQTDYPGGGGFTSPEEALARQAWGDHSFAKGSFPEMDDDEEQEFAEQYPDLVDENELVDEYQAQGELYEDPDYEDPTEWEEEADDGRTELSVQEDYASDEES